MAQLKYDVNSVRECMQANPRGMYNPPGAKQVVFSADLTVGDAKKELGRYSALPERIDSELAGYAVDGKVAMFFAKGAAVIFADAGFDNRERLVIAGEEAWLVKGYDDAARIERDVVAENLRLLQQDPKMVHANVGDIVQAAVKVALENRLYSNAPRARTAMVEGMVYAPPARESRFTRPSSTRTALESENIDPDHIRTVTIYKSGDARVSGGPGIGIKSLQGIEQAAALGVVSFSDSGQPQTAFKERIGAGQDLTRANRDVEAETKLYRTTVNARIKAATDILEILKGEGATNKVREAVFEAWVRKGGLGRRLLRGFRV